MALGSFKHKSMMNEQYNVAGAIRKLKGRKIIVESTTDSELVRDPFGFVIANGVALAADDCKKEFGDGEFGAVQVAEQWLKEYYKKMKSSYRAGVNLTKEFKKWAKKNPDEAANIFALAVDRVEKMGITLNDSDMGQAMEIVKNGF